MDVVITHSHLALLPFQIQVRDVSNNIAIGWLQYYDLDIGIAYVKVTQFLDVCVVNLRHGWDSLPRDDLVCIQLTDSGALTFFMLSKGSSASQDGRVLCKSSKVLSCWFIPCFSFSTCGSRNKYSHHDIIS